MVALAPRLAPPQTKTPQHPTAYQPTSHPNITSDTQHERTHIDALVRLKLVGSEVCRGERFDVELLQERQRAEQGARDSLLNGIEDAVRGVARELLGDVKVRSQGLADPEPALKRWTMGTDGGIDR